MLQQGTAISDAAAFLDTSSGWSFAAEHSTTISLENGSVVCVPDGYITTVLHLLKEKMQNTSAPIGFVVGVTHWHEAWAAMAGDAVWKSIAELNLRFLDTTTGDKVYAARHDLCTRFSTAVTDELKQ